MPKTFEELFTKYFTDLKKMAMWLCKDPVEADDLVQESALRAFRSFDTFKQDAPFKPWMFTILTNVFIDSRRKKKKSETYTDFQYGEPSIEKTAESPPQHFTIDEVEDFEEYVDDQIKDAIADMPEKYRIVFLLNALGELSYKEIAATLGCPIGTVMSRLYRGRKVLKKSLQNYQPWK